MAGRNARKKESEILIIPRNYVEKTQDDTIAITIALLNELLKKDAISEMSITQQKLFFMVFGEINWKEKGNPTHLIFSNEDLMKGIGWDIKRKRSLRQILVEQFQEMTKHTHFFIQNPYTEEWITGNLIERARGDRNITHVYLNPQVMPFIEELYELYEKTGLPFAQCMKGDMKYFTSSFSAPLYGKLLAEFKPKYHPNYLTISLDGIKELFGIKKDAYMKYKKIKDENFDQKADKMSIGTFDSSNFMKKVLVPAINDINSGESICILPWEDNSFIRTDKSGSRIISYTFKYYVRNENGVKKLRKEKLKEFNKINNKQGKGAENASEKGC